MFVAYNHVDGQGVKDIDLDKSGIFVQDTPYKVWHDPDPGHQPGGPVWGGPTFNNSNYVGVP